MMLAELPQAEFGDAEIIFAARNRIATDEFLARLWYFHPKGDQHARRPGTYVTATDLPAVEAEPVQPEPIKPLPPVQDQWLKLANEYLAGRKLDPIAPAGPTVREIQRVVCEFYKLPFIDLISKRRDKTVIRPRFVAIHLCRKHTQRSLPDIARRFGGRDHTSALSSLRRMKTWIEADSDLAAEVAEIEARICA